MKKNIKFIGLGLENFRVFKTSSEFDFAPITLLTGANNSGKSSLIKALLLLAANSIDDITNFKLDFEKRNDVTKLGNFESVKNGNGVICFVLHFANLEKKLERPIHHNPIAQVLFEQLAQNPFWLQLSFDEAKKENLVQLKLFFGENKDLLFSFDFFESAQKLCVNEVNFDKIKATFLQITQNTKQQTAPNWQNITNETFDIKQFKNIFGVLDLILENRSSDKNFEILADILKELIKIAFESLNFALKIDYLPAFRANQNRIYDSSIDLPLNKLLKQFTDKAFSDENQAVQFINRWITKLEIGEKIEFLAITGGTEVNLVAHGKKRPLADFGFGITQLLPLLLKIALCEADFLIIEEVENSLHPNFQALMAELMIDAHQTFGTYFIIETHSEYFLNRIRLLIVKEAIPVDLLKIYFLNYSAQENAAQKFDIHFAKDGQITNAPPNFFETYFLDTMSIALNA